MIKKALANVYNAPEYAYKYKYWVVRYSDGCLWYWGGFDDENRALEVANAEDGTVVEAE